MNEKELLKMEIAWFERVHRLEETDLLVMRHADERLGNYRAALVLLVELVRDAIPEASAAVESSGIMDLMAADSKFSRNFKDFLARMDSKREVVEHEISLLKKRLAALSENDPEET